MLCLFLAMTASVVSVLFFYKICKRSGLWSRSQLMELVGRRSVRVPVDNMFSLPRRQIRLNWKHGSDSKGPCLDMMATGRMRKVGMEDDQLTLGEVIYLVLENRARQVGSMLERAPLASQSYASCAEGALITLQEIPRRINRQSFSCKSFYTSVLNRRRRVSDFGG